MVSICLIQTDDISVPKLAQHLELAHHRLIVVHVLLKLLVNDLGRVEALGRTMAHELDLGEVATPDRLATLSQAERSECVSAQGCGWGGRSKSPWRSQM